MNPHVPGDLPAQWRERADFLAEYGDANGARLWHMAANELDRALDALADSTLNLADAARESGYSADHLGKLVKAGKIPNAGRPNAPRIRRADLPVKEPGGRGRPSRRDAFTIARRRTTRTRKEESR